MRLFHGPFSSMMIVVGASPLSVSNCGILVSQQNLHYFCPTRANVLAPKTFVSGFQVLVEVLRPRFNTQIICQDLAIKAAIIVEDCGQKELGLATVHCY